MKTYEQMTQSVLDKAKTQKAAQRRRNNCLGLVAAGLCCIVLTITLFGRQKTPDIPQTDLSVSSTDSIDTAKPRIVLLCAASDKEEPKVMEERVITPYQAELRVRDITGMTEEQIHKIGEEEATYISKMFGTCSDNKAYGQYVLDNAFVTTISLGEFGIKLNDIDMVARLRVTTTENGILHSYPDLNAYNNYTEIERIEGDTIYINTDDFEQSPILPRTLEDRQQLHIDVDGKRLKEILARDKKDMLGLFWHISPWAVRKLNEDPQMDRSQFSDQITIRIEYTDGRVELTKIRMQIDSEGKVCAVLKGTIIGT